MTNVRRHIIILADRNGSITLVTTGKYHQFPPVAARLLHHRPRRHGSNYGAWCIKRGSLFLFPRRTKVFVIVIVAYSGGEKRKFSTDCIQ
jgi:hypothetical protein